MHSPLALNQWHPLSSYGFIDHRFFPTIISQHFPPHPFKPVHHLSSPSEMTMTISYSRSRTAFLVSAFLLLLLSIITVSLYSSTLALISNPIVDQSDLINFDRQSFPVLQVLPQNLNSASSKLALASSVICLAVSLACTIFAVLFWPDGKRVSIFQSL
jgi:hypothetical protein